MLGPGAGSVMNGARQALMLAALCSGGLIHTAKGAAPHGVCAVFPRVPVLNPGGDAELQGAHGVLRLRGAGEESMSRKRRREPATHEDADSSHDDEVPFIGRGAALEHGVAALLQRC